MYLLDCGCNRVVLKGGGAVGKNDHEAAQAAERVVSPDGHQPQLAAVHEAAAQCERAGTAGGAGRTGAGESDRAPSGEV